MTESIETYGLRYVAKGWPIFPCHSIKSGACTCNKGSRCSSPGKHPRTPNGVKDATTDPAVVLNWAQRFGEDMNWALACGRDSGVVVIDIDVKKNGFDSIEEFEAGRPDGPLPSTLSVHTGGGGKHLYVSYPDDGLMLGNRTGWLPGVDVRSDGGYVVLPPSDHITGGNYRWDSGDVPLAPLPSDVLDSIRGSGPGRSNQSTLASTSDVLDGIPEGERDNTLFRAACRWRRLHESKEDDGRAAVEALALAAARRCKPPFPEDEALRKVEQAYAQDHSDAEPIWEYLGIHPFNDHGNASRLVDRFKDDLRYVAATKTWHVWNGRYWVPDEGNVMVLGKARELSQILMQEAEFSIGPKERANVQKFARESGNHMRMSSAVKVAQSDERVAASPDDFDAQPYFLNCQNGVVDLRTGGLRPHAPGLMLSKIVPHTYDPTAKDPEVWLGVVERLVRFPEDAELLHRYTGYALTGYVREDKALFIKGPPRNGKSTVVKAVHMILGEGYGAVGHEDLLAAVKSKHDDVKAHIVGKRVVITAETAGDQRLDVKFFKRLTGGDGLNARRLYAHSRDYVPTWKLLIATNEMMSSTRRDAAVTERLLIIEANETIAPEQRNPFLDDDLAAEAEQILAWMVKQAVKWWAEIQASNDDPSRRTTGLPVTSSAQDAARMYEDESDPLAEWIESRCVVGEGQRMKSADAWRSYKDWAEFYRTERPLKKGEFFAQLRMHPGISQPTHKKWFDGLGVAETNLYGL